MSHIEAKKANPVVTAVLAMAVKDRSLYEEIAREWRHTEKLYLGVNKRSFIVTNALPRKIASRGKYVLFAPKATGIDYDYAGAKKFITPYTLSTFKFREGDLYEVNRNEFLSRLAMELQC